MFGIVSGKLFLTDVLLKVLLSLLCLSVAFRMFYYILWFSE